jgi:hypothetical protein
MSHFVEARIFQCAWLREIAWHDSASPWLKVQARNVSEAPEG